jgi:lipopolysaccharide biosynthesis glycosyltransferase
MRHRPSPSTVAIDEQDVAFFGAVDSRRYLFLLAVTLQSVARFHHHAGFFVLAPPGSSAAWAPLLRQWTNGTAELLELQDDAAQFERPQGGGYSAMTFHRLRMPQMLLARGYAFSVNLDPDVLCVAPFDLSLFPFVKLVAGRPVRPSNGGLPMWLYEQTHVPSEKAALLNSTLKKLGITSQALEWVPELNGGVLIFNNVRAARVKLFQTCLRTFYSVAQTIEGDQDLLNVVLAANPSFHVHKLPTAYNFAFSRDRESIPNVLGMRLRLAMFSQLICIHFVLDGKPWQAQSLPRKDYPPWLLVTRLHYLREWLQVARGLRPRPAFLTGPVERRAALVRGVFVLNRTSMAPSKTLKAGVLEEEVLQTCVCFLQQMSRTKSADPMHVLRAEEAVMANNSSPSSGSLAGEGGMMRRRALYHRQAMAARARRESLLHECERALPRESRMSNTHSCDRLR